ncbi:hypothetical protein GJ496_000023 [Pomphorhynchus laevis]|nr:hypothetical protein GJ496_000023 [Pomphorhynchus laevis]
MHFQYNSLLFALAISVAFHIMNGNLVFACFIYGCLISMKHTYICYAPGIAMYLLHKNRNLDPTLLILQIVQFGFSAAVPILVSFMPFILTGNINNVFCRLFPFHRGLTHTYWAPNAWAIYNTLDIVLSRLKGGNLIHKDSTTRGVTQQVVHKVLPKVEPIHCLLLTLTTAGLTLIIKRNHHFLYLMTISAFAAFFFGWHVHEKALLTVSIPLLLLMYHDKTYHRPGFIVYLMQSLSISTLIFTPYECMIKLPLFVFCMGLIYTFIKHSDNERSVFTVIDKIIMYTIGFCCLFCEVVPFKHFPYLARFQFLPLMEHLEEIIIAIREKDCQSVFHYRLAKSNNYKETQMTTILQMNSKELIEKLNTIDSTSEVDASDLWLHSSAIPAFTNTPVLYNLSDRHHPTSSEMIADFDRLSLDDLTAMKNVCKWSSIVDCTTDMLAYKLRNNVNVRKDKTLMQIWSIRLFALVNLGQLTQANQECSSLGDFESVSFANDDDNFTNTVSFDLRALSAYSLQLSASKSLVLMYTMLLKCNCILTCNFVSKNIKASDLWKSRRVNLCQLICEKLVANDQIKKALSVASILNTDQIWTRIYLAMLSYGNEAFNSDRIPDRIKEKCKGFTLAFNGDFEGAAVYFDSQDDTGNTAVCNAYSAKFKEALDKLWTLNRTHASRCVMANFDIYCNKLMNRI